MESVKVLEGVMLISWFVLFDFIFVHLGRFSVRSFALRNAEKLPWLQVMAGRQLCLVQLQVLEVEDHFSLVLLLVKVRVQETGRQLQCAPYLELERLWRKWLLFALVLQALHL